jgi:magnesium chelatase subunit D
MSPAADADDSAGLPELAAALLAIDPAGLGGAALRGPAGATRQAWLDGFRRLLPAHTPLRRVPLNIQDGALLGGLDLGATLQAGRPVMQTGVLAQAHGGLVLLPMAERLSAGTAARLAQVLDTGALRVERDGLRLEQPLHIGVLALDEGASDDEQLPTALADRLAFHLLLDGTPPAEAPTWHADDIAQARARLPQIHTDDQVLHALCATALGLGITSLRAPLLALRAARAAAALAEDDAVAPEHAALAVALVLAPRATRSPAPDQSVADADPPPPNSEPTDAEPDPPPPDDPLDDPSDSTDPQAPATPDAPLADVLLQAAQAAIPAGLLAALRAGQAQRNRARSAGRSGAVLHGASRGRPLGARRGEPRAGARLSVIDTLRAAAPWQRLRGAAPASAPDAGTRPRLQVRPEDFHVTRYKQTRQTTTVFVVDASGSSALNRLAEAKGAVELLLAECYVRRDRVAVLAFRGEGVELLLPPTRSLARAKRCLAALPGGGGTPLAHAIEAAGALADQVLRRGETPVLVLLTDGRANIARDGAPGRTRATDDALTAARQLRPNGFSSLLLDTSPQPQTSARTLAEAMGAAYLPLPHAGAAGLAQAVRLATASRG